MNKEHYELRSLKNDITMAWKAGTLEACIEEYEECKKEFAKFNEFTWLLVKITETEEVLG